MIQYCFILFSFAIKNIHGHSDGADISVCMDINMKPGHGFSFQNSLSPYSLLIDSCDFSYCSITIEGNDDFKGILLRAVDDKNNFVGKFVNVGNTTKLICNDSAITHAIILNSSKLKASWLIGNLTGSIYFRATIVKNYSIFWNIRNVHYINNASFNLSYSTSGFDDTNSSNVDNWTLSRSFPTLWTTDSFTSLTATITHKLTGDDSIILCSRSTELYTAELWYSVGRSINKATNPLEGLGSNNTLGLYSEGWMSCKFSKEIKRQSSLANKDDNLVYYLDGELYYLLFATGDINEGTPKKHDRRMASTTAINFTDFKPSIIASGSISNSLIKAHGILMTIAWLMIASFTILMPRYFKSAWPDTKILKKPLWFIGHQTLMVLVFILTAIAFIIIFCEAKGYAMLTTPVAMAHPPVGIIVMILVFINPVMALIRCHPDHQHRWIFNFFHSLVGELVLIFAVINIFLSFYIPQVNIGHWVKWVMVALICWHVFIELLLILLEKYLQAPSQSRQREISGFEFVEPMISPKINISIVKSILVASQWVGVTSLAIAICVGIGVAA